MRLNRLDLIRYGRFRDAVLDFGAAPAGGPDVSVVYGANEAGKSTAFTAWLDFLFGFQGASRYAFQFDRKDLLVGAVVETPDGAQALRRSAATTGSLTDANGHALAEGRLAGWLHGLDREAYRTRFSLNDVILRQGGEEIARAQGDLGQLLHAGSSGLAGLSDTLGKIEAEVEAFHKKGGRKTQANEGRNRLRELDAELRNVRLDPRGFDRLLAARDDAEAAFAGAREALVAAKRALGLCDAAAARRGIAREIDAARRAFADYPDGPPLLPGAVSRVVAAAQRRSAAEAAGAKARRASAARGQLEALDDDPGGREVAALLATLEAAVFEDGQPLLPRAQTAHADLPRRREEHARIGAEMAALAARLAGADSDPGSVALSRARIADIRGAADAVRTARAALNGEMKVRLKAEAELGDPVEEPRGVDALADALTAWHRLPGIADQTAEAARQAGAALAEALAGLPPDWRATAEAGLPETAEIEAVAEASQRALGERDTRAGLRDEAERDWQLARDGCDATEARAEVVSDREVAASRARRDEAWAAHRRALDPATADSFERALREDDAARVRHAATTENRLRLAQLSEDAARRRGVLDGRASALAAAEIEAAAAGAAVAAMAARLGLPASAPAKALRPRRDRLQAALAGAHRAEAAEAAAREAREDRALRIADLRAALADAGVEGRDDRLPAIADRVLDDLRARRAAAHAWRESRAAIDRMARSEAAAGQALADLAATLAARLDGAWCAGFDADRVLDALPDLEALATLDEERGRLEARIRAMEEAAEAFAPSARRLGAHLDLPGAAAPTEILAAARRRAGEAAEAARRFRAETDALARAEAEIRDAAVECATRTAEIGDLLAGQAGPDAEDPIALVNRLAARDELRGGLARSEVAYAAAGRGFDPADLAAAEADADPARAETLREAAREAEEARDAALEQRSRARTMLEAALAGEGGATLDQERAALVETLRQAGREALARQFGLLAARSALRRFRQSHRGSMLETTEQTFAHITGGEWPRLDTQREGAAERLVGVRDDVPVAVGAMSTGTQGQLYLALRIAGHAAFVAAHGPLPFVTDDIHETFDDDRSRAALELAATMGERGQTILFTHHRHLVELARATIPSARILELRAR